MRRLRLGWAAALGLSVMSALAAPLDWPADHRGRTTPLTHRQVCDLVAWADEAAHVETEEIGRSAEDRPLFLVHLRGPGEPSWRVMFIGQQHGDEHAGKDALCHLIRDLAEHPERLAPGVDLWIVPQANPDGSEADRRTNANRMDLNRDHLVLSQPETRAIHAAVQRVHPDVTVDCHEFGRDSGDYTARGWTEWPQIMMDAANHPLFGADRLEAALWWVDSARPALEAAGHNYMRYHVGAAPGAGEMRHSTLECNDARNGLAMHGGLSFIIESGVRRGLDNRHADLGARVDAYLVLLRRFLDVTERRANDRAVIDASRTAPLPAFLPTNVMWGNHGLRVTAVPVIDLETGQTRHIETANFLHDVIVKSTVTTPRAYAIPPDAASAEALVEIVERHGLAHERLLTPRTLLAERTRLVEIQEDEEPIHSRYGGRQIVERDFAARRDFPAGTVLVPLDQPGAVRAALVLEPNQLYGLWGGETVRIGVDGDGTMPVWRVME
ncbi:MAG: succinylglutamate desuccinylase/aspartoacylase family protein [Candidatus Sumerlaeia bacterium]|nr:succinylglutamate desuccinylase/aspartoacylase family protein [Candidatus Sumerlaeia bacterium]